MKTLQIPNGGMPFTGDDLLWMQDGLKEAVEAAVSPFLVEGKCILSGCAIRIESGNIVIDPGYIVIGGRILRFGGKIIPGINLANHEFYIKYEWDPAGNDVFADSVSRDTYQKVSADTRAFTVENGTTIRLSSAEGLRLSLRQSNYKRLMFEGTNTKIWISRFGPVVTINGLLGPETPINTGIYTIPVDERPSDLFRTIPVRSWLGDKSGTVNILNGVISYIGDPINTYGFQFASFALTYHL